VEGRCQLPSQRYYAAMFSNTAGKVSHCTVPTCKTKFYKVVQTDFEGNATCDYIQVVVAGGYSGRAGWLRDLDVLNNLTPNCEQVS
jgi:hypothetical protein